MRTLEEIEELIRNTNNEIEDICKKKDDLASQLYWLNFERDTILLNKAREISPFKENNIYSICGMDYKVIITEIVSDDLHVCFGKCNKDGSISKRADYKHLYVALDTLPNLDMSTIQTTMHEYITLIEK